MSSLSEAELCAVTDVLRVYVDRREDPRQTDAWRRLTQVEKAMVLERLRAATAGVHGAASPDAADAGARIGAASSVGSAAAAAGVESVPSTPVGDDSVEGTRKRARMASAPSASFSERMASMAEKARRAVQSVATPEQSAAVDPVMLMSPAAALAREQGPQRRALKAREREMLKEADVLARRMMAGRANEEPSTADDDASEAQLLAQAQEQFVQMFHDELAGMWVEPPPGTKFFRVVRSMMHGFGDAAAPHPEAVVLVERDALAFASRLVHGMRALLGRDSLRIGDFLSLLHDATHTYFRWRALKEMSAAEPPEAKAVTSAGPAGATEAYESSDNEAGDDARSTVSTADDESASSTEEETHVREHGEVDETQFEPEDAEETAQLERLREQAEAELRDGVATGPPEETVPRRASSPMPHDTDASATEGIPRSQTTAAAWEKALGLQASWKVCEARLRFANERSKGMSISAYVLYSRAREAGFTAKTKTAALFAASLPRPPVTRAALDVLAFLAYDRAGCVVEAASRVSNMGMMRAADPGHQFSLASYQAAIAAMPELPEELAAHLQDRAAQARRARELVALRALRNTPFQAVGATTVNDASPVSLPGGSPSMQSLDASFGQAPTHTIDELAVLDASKQRLARLAPMPPASRKRQRK